MIFEFDSNRGLFVARSTGPKSGMAEAVNRPKLALAYRQNIYPMKLKFVFL